MSFIRVNGMSFIRVVRNCVHREIASCKVILKRNTKFNGIRAPVVAIRSFLTVGSYLNNF